MAAPAAAAQDAPSSAGGGYLPQNDSSSTTTTSRRGRLDYYAILGLAPTATDEQIRRAHRQLAVLCHVDKHVGQPQEVLDLLRKRYEQINEAFDTLGDKHKRAAYDALGRRGVKSLGSLIPQDVQQSGAFQTETIIKLLKISEEEHNLLKTAIRVGSSSSLEMNFNSQPLMQTIVAAARNFVDTTKTWAENDEETEWNIPGGEKKMKLIPRAEPEPSPPAAAAAAAEQEQQQNVDEKHQQQQSTTLTTTTTLPTPPTKPSFSVSAPLVIMVDLNGKQSYALIPTPHDQAAVKEKVEEYSKAEKEYVEQKQKIAEKDPEAGRMLELRDKRQEAKDMEMLHAIGEASQEMAAEKQEGEQQQHEQQQQLGIPNSEQEQEQEQYRIVLGRPPLWILLFYWVFGWAPTFQQNLRAACTPVSVNGRYSFQLPIGARTVSLFSVTGARSHAGKHSEFKCEIDAETKHSSTLTWLWSGSLGTSGTKLQVGFQRILSAAWSAKLKLMAWKETGEGFLPQLYCSVSRKLSSIWSLTAGVRLLGPWESAAGRRVGNMSVTLNGKEEGFGLLLGPGSLQMTFAKTRRFVFFPVVAAAAAVANNNKEDEEQQEQQPAAEQQEQRSAISALRRFDTTVEKSVELHVSADPVVRHEDTFYFSRVIDEPTSMAKQAAREAKRAAKKEAAAERRANKKSGNNSKNVEDDEAKNLKEKLLLDSSDDDLDFCTDDDDDSDSEDDETSPNGGARFTEQQQQRSSSSFHHKTFDRFFESKFKSDEIHTMAAPLLRHSLGFSVSTAIPLLALLSPKSLAGKNRGCNTTVSLVYKRGEHRIALPIRVSFSPSPILGVFLSAFPYICNKLLAPLATTILEGKQRRRCVRRRLLMEPRIQRQMRRAMLEQDHMEVTVRKSVAEETRRNGLIIVNATFGVLEPVLSYQMQQRRNNNDDDDGGDNASAAASAPAIALTCDVTKPVQHLVALSGASQVFIAGGSPKHLLTGFYDPHPCCGGGGIEQKRLKVVYRFQGRLHEVVVGDTEELRMPLAAHLKKI